MLKRQYTISKMAGFGSSGSAVELLFRNRVWQGEPPLLKNSRVFNTYVTLYRNLDAFGVKVFF
jgi:hypothetical protein